MKFPNSNNRLYLLDVARFYAAIAVVFQHFQHFLDYQNSSFKFEEQPFFQYFFFYINLDQWQYPFFLFYLDLFFLLFIKIKFIIIK